MVVGNKSDGGQTQESDGGNTICTSSSGENYLFLKKKEKWVNYPAGARSVPAGPIGPKGPEQSIFVFITNLQFFAVKLKWLLSH